MSFTRVTTIVGTAVFLMLVATCALCLSRQQFFDARDEFKGRVLELAPYFALAGLFFLIRRFSEGSSQQLSDEIGIEITAEIYAIEGLFVAYVQDLTPTFLVPVFSAFYMFGFAFLLLAPIALYVLAPAMRSLKELLVAYVLNYIIGTAMFTLFIAYGPRVYVSDHVDGLLYDFYPSTAELTSTVSERTDVFPSLHTSLAVIVLLFAWQTRHALPRWLYIAAVMASGVVLSTMVTGIHWLIDVLAGIALAVSCMVLAKRIVLVAEGDDPRRQPDERGAES
jgi:membrane-associated phospholipid phosphatase